MMINLKIVQRPASNLSQILTYTQPECYIETRYFLRAAVSQESRVFYLRMLADTFRYLC